MRQQAWSLAAHRRVEAIDKDMRAEYRTVAMKGPVLLQQSGVMQTLAFFLSRREPAGRLWCQHLAEICEAGDARALLARTQKAPMETYLRQSRDLIDIAVWLRRFAQICIEPPAERARRAGEAGDDGAAEGA